MANDLYRSTRDLTLQQINNGHRDRWPDFPSELRPDLHVGYTGVIFPDGSWVQTRFVGEETAAVYRNNLDTVSFCLVGNFSKKPNNEVVELPTDLQLNRVCELTEAVLSNNPVVMEAAGIKVKSGTTISTSLPNVRPHRYWQQTQCYGSALPDDFAINAMRKLLERKIKILEQMVMIYMAIAKLLSQRSVTPAGGSAMSCWLDNNRG